MRRALRNLFMGWISCSFLLVTAAPASAAFDAESVVHALYRLQALSIVQGVDSSGDPDLTAPITRAQLVTILIRAHGLDAKARQKSGANPYTDVAPEHWASGYIAMAKELVESKGLSLGVTDTTFEPDASVTLSQTLAFVMKFLDIPPKAGLPWPQDYLQGAVEAGIISEVEAEFLGETEANRGLALYLADQVFYNYELPSGKNIYQTYLDPTPPSVTVNRFPSKSDETEITLTGTVSGQSVLWVGHDASDVVIPLANGTWTATLPLELGVNEIWVMAIDQAGNTAVPATPVAVERVPGAPAYIGAENARFDLTVEESALLGVTVWDKNGVQLVNPPLEVDSGGLATFDPATGQLTAGTKSGGGTVTVRSGDVTTSMALTVYPGEPVRLVITPDAPRVEPSWYLWFSVTGLDHYENPVAVTPTWSADQAWAHMAEKTGLFQAVNPGAIKVTATAGDLSATTTVTAQYGVTAPDNRPPRLEQVGNQRSVTGDAISLPITAKDPEGGSLTVWAIDLPPGLAYDAKTGQISGVLGPNDVGTHEVLVAAMDAGGLTDFQSFTWTVAEK